MPASDQGSFTDRYQLVPRTLIFITRGDKILLLKGASHKRLWANRYNGLGGHIERGEEVLGAARRELREESGLVSADLHICGVITIDTGQQTGVGLYVLRGESTIGELHESSEGELEWVPVTKIAGLPLVEDLVVLLPKLLQMQPGDPPFSAHYRYNDSGKMEIVFGE